MSQTDRPLDREAYERSCRESGLDRQFCDRVGDLPLSKEFEGTELSGGEWQRVGIARGMYRRHSLILLDEPTAAINPIEETRLFTQFAELSRGVTSVLITHRLGSVKIADRIFVLKEGEIVEEGNFAELYERGRYFRELYDSQAQWYE